MAKRAMNMTERLKVRLEIWVLILGILGGGGVLGLIGAIWSIPADVKAAQSRVSAVEIRIDRLEKASIENREILIRIEERVKQLQDRSR